MNSARHATTFEKVRCARMRLCIAPPWVPVITATVTRSGVRREKEVLSPPKGGRTRLAREAWVGATRCCLLVLLPAVLLRLALCLRRLLLPEHGLLACRDH